MKKVLLIILCIFCLFIKVNAEEEESDYVINQFEYYNVTIKLKDGVNRFTVIHEFKANEINGKNKFVISETNLFGNKITANLDYELEQNGYPRNQIVFTIEPDVDYKIEYECFNEPYSSKYRFDTLYSAFHDNSYNEFLKKSFVIISTDKKGFSINNINEQYRDKFSRDGNVYTYTVEDATGYMDLDVLIPSNLFEEEYNYFGMFVVNSFIVWIVFTLVNILLCLILFVWSKKSQITKNWIIEYFYLVIATFVIFMGFNANVYAVLPGIFLVLFFSAFFYTLFFKARFFKLNSMKIKNAKKRFKYDVTTQNIISSVGAVEAVSMWLFRLMVIVMSVIFFAVFKDSSDGIPITLDIIVIILNIIIAAIIFDFTPIPGENDDIPIRNE